MKAEGFGNSRRGKGLAKRAEVGQNDPGVLSGWADGILGCFPIVGTSSYPMTLLS